MMNLSKIPKMSNSRAPYTPPRVVRISELRQGGGLAFNHCTTGSGADNCGLGQIPWISCGSGNKPPT